MSFGHPYVSYGVKQCPVCKENKTLESYSHKSGAKDGHQVTCKACVNAKLYKRNSVKYERRLSKYFKYET
jgi:hypothetical protein